MFVPATPGGELVKQLQENEEKMKEGTSRKKIKFVERGGTTVKDMLCRNNPWGKRKCGRDECLVCPDGKEGMGGECRREGVLYLITCKKCQEMGVKAEYWGETARTGYERGGEHLAGLRGRYEKNGLWKHSEIFQGRKLEGIDFKMEIKNSYRSPLMRQIHEGVALEINGAKIIMNSKSEWNHSRIPRIVVEIGDEVEEDIMSGMSRSTELGGRERGGKNIKVKVAEKRRGEVGAQVQGEGGTKRRKLENQEETKEKVKEKKQEKWEKIKADKILTKQRREKRPEGKVVEGESMLREWLETYGIKGGEEHIRRIRGAGGEEGKLRENNTPPPRRLQIENPKESENTQQQRKCPHNEETALHQKSESKSIGMKMGWGEDDFTFRKTVKDDLK